MSSAQAIRRGFVDIDDQPNPSVVHYYRCGSGPPLVLLHPSPMSASVFLPLLARLSAHVTAIAIDTPGYGYSDGFPGIANDLQPYVSRLHAFQKAIGAERVSLYGSATGSQIAVEYAKRYPECCHALVLDNIGDFPQQERDRVMRGYFPDLSADISGSHLTRIWTMSLDVMRFFPWYEHSKTARLPAKPIDPGVVQTMAQQFLLAGADYHKAYRPAFMNERAEALAAVSTPTVVIRSSGSIIKSYADRLDAHEWPDSLRMRHCGAEPEERLQTAVDAVREMTAQAPGNKPSFPASLGDRQMLATPIGNAFCRRHSGNGPAWLILHDIGSSAEGLQGVIASLGERYTVLAPDLPGHGATDVNGGDSDRFLDHCNALICALLDDSAIDCANLLAVGESAAVALQYEATYSDRVGRILLVNPTAGSTVFDPLPCIDGSHLTRLWQALRNDALYWPFDDWTPSAALDGEPNLSASHLNQRTLDLMRSAGSYRSARVACDGVDVRAALRQARDKLRVFRSSDSTVGSRSARCFPAVDSARVVDAATDSLVDIIGRLQ